MILLEHARAIVLAHAVSIAVAEATTPVPSATLDLRTLAPDAES